MIFRSLRPLVALSAVAALALGVACSSNGGATATAEAPPSEVAQAAATTPPTVASPEATSSGPAHTSGETPDVARVMANITALAGDIGIRAAGTEGEDTAAAYIAGVLRDAGYDTTIEPFPVSTRIDSSSVAIEGGITIQPQMMTGSATGEATGPLVYGVLGSSEDLAGLDVTGSVLLLDRGVIAFGEKARAAELAGAVAVIVANNQAGLYNGNLGNRPASIPVVAITRAEGEALRALADSGATTTVRASIDTIAAESQNVVGRNGDVCRFYLGGHYDSVPAGPGANDNASGTAVMLELARTNRVDGLCVVAFGSEEIGLFGSEAYVAKHGLADASFMLNFDMTGRLDDALIIGDSALTDLLLAAVEGLPIRAGQFPPFAASDHVSFLNAGIAAVTITSGDDPQIHTAGDDIYNVSLESLRTMLQVGDLALTAALATAE